MANDGTKRRELRNIDEKDEISDETIGPVVEDRSQMSLN